jgi:2-C-methyl-D-erythritol 4-phosphate cytidylyltransferase/2-C-methyl-D-erythritol 2,4-cyclodiphosphate synthase
MAGPVADVVVVAAGRSSRMDGVDKLAAPIRGRPVLDWAVAAFASAPAVDRIVIVTTPDRVPALGMAPWLPARAVVVAGGERRQESVAAGVAEIERAGVPADRVILVHDGARPAVRADLVSRVVDAVVAHGAAIPVLPVVETLKRIEDQMVAGTVDRDRLGVAQTPQGVRLDLLRVAYRRFPPGDPATFTDEAALLEACTIPVHVLPGDVDNLKVTVPVDLERAAAVLAPGRSAGLTRVGFGEDVHPFGPGRPLALGGIELPGAPRLHGHSDGDVVLHAVAGALLGAAGLGDLGRLFPADARTPRGVASAELLTDVARRLGEAGLAPARVDVTVVGARPRLGDHLDAMAARIAELLGLAPDAVSVKASTGNLAGMEGAGRGISARVIATVESGA